MIELLGLEGYTGHRVASDLMVQEQMLVWAAESIAQKEQQEQDKRDADKLRREAQG